MLLNRHLSFIPHIKETKIKVIRPIQITPEKIISSTAVEEYSEWDSDTNYNTGDRVVYEYKVYESVAESNHNNTPSTSPTKWLLVGDSNKTAMFDNQVNTQTTATTNLNVVFQPGTSFNTIAFLNLVGNSISVKIKDKPGGVDIYDQTIKLNNDKYSVVDWYTYFFEDFDFIQEAVFQNVPPYSSATIEVNVDGGTGGLVATGSVCVGSIIEIGGTQYGATYGNRDYSVKSTDEFGNTKFVERNYSKRVSANILMPNTRMNYVSRILENLRATPTVYIPSDDIKFSRTVVFGFLKDWNIAINYPNHSLISMDIEGLI